MTKDKHGRPVKIGKALEKTGASDHIKNTFANDPERQQQKSDQHHVEISVDPVITLIVIYSSEWLILKLIT
jgi:hypothetical protein